MIPPLIYYLEDLAWSLNHFLLTQYTIPHFLKNVSITATQSVDSLSSVYLELLKELLEVSFSQIRISRPFHYTYDMYNSVAW